MSSESIVLKLSPKREDLVNEVKLGGEMAEVCEIQITYDNPENSEFSVELPLEDRYFCTSLQGNDPKIRDLCLKVEEGEYTVSFILLEITYSLDPL